MSNKKILLVGATGHQGRALIAALKINTTAITETANDSPASSFRVLALTRSPKSRKAEKLASYPHVEIVQGNLDYPETIRKVFEDAKASSTGRIWGVFCVLQFPGLGANADGEEEQGKLMAELSLEYGVSSFILSTVERGGEKDDDTMKLDRLAKVRIERHVRELGSRGLNWAILRPAFFMENYEGIVGSITVGVLKAGLKSNTTIQMVAAEDIGRVAAGVFRDFDSFKFQILIVSGERSTMAEQEEAYKRATGKPLPSTNRLIAKALIRGNKHTRYLISDIERVHNTIIGEFREESEAQLALTRKAYPDLMGLEQWAREKIAVVGSKSRRKEWNGVSVWRLITGSQ